MKKILLAVFISIGSYLTTNAQCTPAVVGNAGVYPDSATNFVQAFQNQPYNQIITIKVPADTVYLGTTFTFNYFEMTGLSGLPMGLSYACNPSDCKFPGNSTKCAEISGTTTAPVGTYPLTITVDVYVVGVPIAITQQTLTYYKIIVNPDNTGILEGIKANSFSVSQSVPNPSNDKSTFYYNLTSRSEVQVKIVNAIGKEVCSTRVVGNNGTNQFVINTADLPSGIYLYSLNSGSNIITKRFIVNH